MFLVGLLLLVSSGVLCAETVTGTVVRVVDGDTMVVETRGRRSEGGGRKAEVRGPRSEVRGRRSEVRGPRASGRDGVGAPVREVRVRLAGIDTPEKRQPFGARAGEALSELILGKVVRVEFNAKDRYGRVIGTVYLCEMNVNRTMVAEGFAWHYTKYSSCPVLAGAEARAREERVGLWRQGSPVAPWVFRRL